MAAIRASADCFQMDLMANIVPHNLCIRQITSIVKYSLKLASSQSMTTQITFRWSGGEAYQHVLRVAA
jgi:hypothetical protein